MYEQEFSQNNRVALSNLLYTHTYPSITTNKLVNEDKKSMLDSWDKLCSDSEVIYRDDKLFNSAEAWLNSLGIETRTEYNNLLPTYNLFLKIGEWLDKKLVEENNE